MKKKKLLVLDLDETLIRTDLLFEQALQFVKQRPLSGLKCLPAAIRGPLALKNLLVQSTLLEPADLPYRQSIVDRALDARKSGDKVLLMSASPLPWVQRIAQHLGCIDFVEGTSEILNLKGPEKLKRLQEKYSDYCWVAFSDSAADLPILNASDECVLVNPSEGLKSKLKNRSVSVIDDREDFFKILLKQLRVHQWVKNILVFLPLMLAHQWHEVHSVLSLLLSFFAFSFVASSVYILNDALDLGADRGHKLKKHRPLASGALSLRAGFFLFYFLLAGGVIFSGLVGSKFSLLLLTYFVLNLMYSTWVKRIAIFDVSLLSFMYTLRILAGAAAVSIQVSPWLLSFSTFFFMGLAVAKRAAEIKGIKSAMSVDHLQPMKILGRGYSTDDFIIMLVIGAGSSLLSVLVLSLYMTSDQVRILYSSPDQLWWMTPVALFWFFRIWLFVGRGQMDEDPIAFAIKDRVSWIVFVLTLFILWSAAF